MDFHTHIFNVKKDDLDELNHVNNVRYIEWIQELSKAHWANKSGNRFNESYVWVVRRHEIIYYKAAKLNDVILGITHISKNKGPISTRIVEFRDNKSDDLIVKSTTDWCLLDSKTQRPQRIPEAISELFL